MPMKILPPSAWQEEWSRRIEAGIDAADRGEFASQEEIDQVVNKYRPEEL